MTTATQTAPVDQQKAEEFAGYVLGVLNGGMLSLALSIGSQTGLFDKMAELGSTTSDEIADATGLSERYVREWLGAVTTGRIVEYDARERTYRLPPEHAASITRAAGPDNLADLARFVPLLGRVEEPVIRSFREGGGVPYEQFDRFQEVMRRDSAKVFDATLVDVTLPIVPGIVERLRQGIDVADIGCGAGHAINLMAQAFPNSRFTGYDFSEEGIAMAREEAASLGLTNARFEVKDVAQLDGSLTFDFITAFDAIHDQAQPRRVLAGINTSLRSGGTFLCVDIAASSDLAANLAHPLAPWLYTISMMHCMTVSLAYGGEGLGTVWGEEQAIELLREAGFGEIDVHRVEGDILNNYYIARKA